MEDPVGPASVSLLHCFVNVDNKGPRVMYYSYSLLKIDSWLMGGYLLA